MASTSKSDWEVETDSEQPPTGESEVTPGEVPLNTQDEILCYMTEHENALAQLIQSLETANEFMVFENGVKRLHKILVVGQLLNKSDTTLITTYIHKETFVSFLNNICTIRQKFLRELHFRLLEMDLYAQLLNITSDLCAVKQYQRQIRKHHDFLVFLCVTLEKNPRKDVALSCLNLLKIICENGNNCRYLAYKKFCHYLVFTSRLVDVCSSVVDVFILMAMNQTAFQYISHDEKVIMLLLDYVTCSDESPVSKYGAANVLQNMTSEVSALESLKRRENHRKLQNYFLNCKNKEENGCRLKVYAILNRFKNVVDLTVDNLNINFGLSYFLKRKVQQEKVMEKWDSKTYTESYQSSEEEQENVATAVEPELLEPSGNEQDNTLSSTDAEPELDIQCYFLEYVGENLDPVANIFRTFNDETQYDDNKIQQQITRPSNLRGLAFPDAIMLEPKSSEAKVETPKLPVKYLAHKLSSIHNRTQPLHRVVFNLDELCRNDEDIIIPQPDSFVPPESDAHVQIKGDSLQFESRFENGNLRKVTKVDAYEYNLELSPDTLTVEGFNWFYFQVGNMTGGVEYTFNIINFTRDKPVLNEGLRPVMFSLTNFLLNNIEWRQLKGAIAYYGNHYNNASTLKQFRTLTFSTVFPFTADYVYIAYHFPYTYTRLMMLLAPVPNLQSTHIYSRLDKLCDTVNGANEVALLTVTSSLDCPDSLAIPLNKRPIIFLTARVHSGESNASWVMEGIIKQLLNEADPISASARERFVFKVVPMLNIEGVICGNSRRGLTGVDLNRCWANPSKDTTPEIYYTKKLVDYSKRQRQFPFSTYVDIHGHSQNKFSFFYGCNPKESWKRNDRKKDDTLETLQMLPDMMAEMNPNFRSTECEYKIVKSREKTARVVMWREFEIVHSYTLECSFAKAYQEQLVTPEILMGIGSSVVQSFGKIVDDAQKGEQFIGCFQSE